MSLIADLVSGLVGAIAGAARVTPEQREGRTLTKRANAALRQRARAIRERKAAARRGDVDGVNAANADLVAADAELAAVEAAR